MAVVVFCTGECVDMDIMDTVEDTFFDIGILLFQFFYQILYLQSFAVACAVGAVLGKAAGALQKAQLVVSHPRNYAVLVNLVQGTYKLHSGIVLAF
jgi:hypothetical protein